MSHLIEEYAKNLGVKIAKPIFSKHFWPLSSNKFITISLDSHIPSKNYKYYEIVIDLIRNKLNDNGYKIIQIGSSQSTKLNNVDERIFDLPFKNAAYVLSKSSLHIGVDNIFCHIASSLDVPLITLFGNVYPKISCGFWGKSAINIQAPWSVKPCLNGIDPEDSINKIKPEQIAEAIFSQLKINNKINVKTAFIGDFYDNKIIELVPDFISDVQNFDQQHIFIREDYCSGSPFFVLWLQRLQSVSIFTKSILPINLLDQFKQKIKHVSFIVSKVFEFPEGYLENLEKTGIQITLLAEKEEDLPFLREKFFDFTVHYYFKGNRSLLGDKFSFEKPLFFVSSKNLISKGKSFPSKYHWQNNINLNGQPLIFENNIDLIEDINHFYIYEKVS